jgi:hypothetical protein
MTFWSETNLFVVPKTKRVAEKHRMQKFVLLTPGPGTTPASPGPSQSAE